MTPSDLFGTGPPISEKFTIPSSDPAFVYLNPADPSSELAKRELFNGFLHDNWERTHRRRDSNLRYWLRIGLFFIVIAMNLWWDRQILAMFWQSGRVNTGFHLADSVLIALATTSVANFIALIIIVAKHLYPSNEQNEK